MSQDKTVHTVNTTDLYVSLASDSIKGSVPSVVRDVRTPTTQGVLVKPD